MTATDYKHQLWMKTLRCRSVYTDNMVKSFFVEGVNKSICRTLRQRRLEHQSDLLGYLVQKAELFTDLPGNKPRLDNRLDSLQTKPRKDLRTNRRRQPRDRRVMNIEQPSASRTPGRHSNRSTSSDYYETSTAMSIRNFVTAVWSVEFDLHDTTSMDSTKFCSVCFKDNHKT